MTERWTSGLLVDRIRATFPLPEWAVGEQVANGTGSNARRWADAVAFSCYPSRGLEIVGFEVKVSRNDWTRELGRPDKAEEIAAYCDRWFIVAPAGIVKDGELPKAWGLLTPDPKSDRLVYAKNAETTESKPVNRSFLAAVLRGMVRADENIITRRVEEAREKAHERGLEQGRAQGADGYSNHALKELTERVRKFEAASGVKIDTWNGGIPSARAIRAAGALTDDYVRDFSSRANDLDKAAKDAREALAGIERIRRALLAGAEDKDAAATE